LWTLQKCNSQEICYRRNKEFSSKGKRKKKGGKARKGEVEGVGRGKRGGGKKGKRKRR
jgi:hypothetical protein